jgi:hypothetical protein
MKTTYVLLLFLVFSHLSVLASVPTDSLFTESIITLTTVSGTIYGTLTMPAQPTKCPVALIIAGSGPTDRNGNSPLTQNDALKKLAHRLSSHRIASVRFDKRGIGESRAAFKSEADLRFEDYINDAKEWVQLLKNDKRFSKVIIIGHSEGSLIGMLAASKADQFISIAGAGQSADLLLKEQFRTLPAEGQQMAFPILDSLKNGKQVSNVNPMLFSIFRPSVQPYMISWFKYDPQQEIKKLTIPILLIQGTKDIQTSVGDAQKLSIANPKATLVLIEQMNHILRKVEGDRNDNVATYGKLELPLMPELEVALVNFIMKKGNK